MIYTTTSIQDTDRDGWMKGAEVLVLSPSPGGAPGGPPEGNLKNKWKKEGGEEVNDVISRISGYVWVLG